MSAVTSLAVLDTPSTNLTVSVVPPNSYSTASGGGLQTTSVVNSSISNGVAPFTYAWTVLSGSPITITTPTNSGTSFSATLGLGQTLSSVVRLSVTDVWGSTGFVDISVTFVDTSIGGGGGSTNSYLLLEDGSSYLLLEDGVSKLILEFVPTPYGFLLLEDGFSFFLLEDGISKLILE